MMQRISSTPTSKQKKGFTFLEMLLVLAIITGIVGIGVPLIYDSIRSPLSLASNKLISIVNEVRFKAILNNRPLVLQIDPEENLYQILQRDTDSGEWVPEEKNKEAIPVSDDVQIKEIQKGLETFTDEKVQILFEPAGILRIFSVTFSSGNAQETVRVKNVFGELEIEDTEP